MAGEDPLFLGLDLSTQGLKAVLVDAQRRVVHEAGVAFDERLPAYGTASGRHVRGSEVTAPVLMWVEAVDLLMAELGAAGLAPRVRGISGAAQQHGSVYWRQRGVEALSALDSGRSLGENLAAAFALADSPIWEDSSTAQQCRDLERAAGGAAALARISGSAAFERFTGPQAAKIRQTQPGAWADTARISLVSSFVASLLVGAVAPVDCGDASGTNVYDVRARAWSRPLCDSIDGRLASMLGEAVVMADTSVGVLLPYYVRRYGFARCPVVAFTGDNPSAFAGFEALRAAAEPSVAVLSLGTSDTVLLPLDRYPYAADALPLPAKQRPDGHVLQHPTAPDRYIAMLCYKNGSLAREWVRDHTLGPGAAWDAFDAAAAGDPLAPAAFGFYYLAPEIQPRAHGVHRFERCSDGPVVCPSGARYRPVGSLDHIRPGGDARAIIESQVMAMRVDHARKSAAPLASVAVTGGASGSRALQQAIADVLGVRVLAAGVQGSRGFEPRTPAMPALGGAIPRAYSARPPARSDSDGGSERQKVTIQTIRKLHASGTPISMMTAYDYPTSVACERAGVDMVLVGDSLAMVALGHEDTSQITMPEMIHHTRAVARGTRSAFLVADLPFGAYQSDETSAVNNAIRMVKEGRAEAVKLEAGRRAAAKLDAIANGAGIPVVGHIGLTPQTAVALGGFRVQGKSLAGAQALVDDALALQSAGCFAVVLEAMPSLVAEAITRLLAIPTIGIGAGPATSGQVLVLSDMAGLFDRFTPKFCRAFADLGPRMAAAIGEYNHAVRTRGFPAEGVHTYAMSPATEDRWRAYVQKQFGLELGSAAEQAAPPQSAAAAGPQ
ncbi:hypothetical protein H4R18_005825 [Coemansia javaensis]|uniref:3-methyl-2-oxobutanoate hydroxymethyltransferase n=1 Tax=Coemansia javaensis TaxID=2761396 RepID=A0A9W8H0H3_9FUNG|nr:hypothetical protein H4R18_005825 [Coemansia javaensis]